MSSNDDAILQIVKAIVYLSQKDIKALETVSTETQKIFDVKSKTKYKVTDVFAAFMMRAVALDPYYRFNIEYELKHEEVERLINICVAKITAINDPQMETIRMQIFFDSNFTSQREFLSQEKRQRLGSCAELLHEITNTKSKKLDNFEALNRNIVTYTLLRSGCGDPTNMKVTREATAALESVFPNSELVPFLGLSRTEKETQLNGLTNLVTGIRLYNKHLKKGGDTIPDLQDLCQNELKALSSMVNNETTSCENKIQTIKAVLDYMATTTEETELPKETLPKLIQSLVGHRQYLIYLDALHQQCQEASQLLTQLDAQNDQIISELKFVCKSKSAVPVDQVYPLFIQFSSLWFYWFDELFLLAFARGILDTLQQISKGLVVAVPSVIETLAEKFKCDIEPEILDDSIVVDNATNLMKALVTVDKTVEVVHPGNTTQYYKLPVEFGGFCAVTLVKRSGIVTPGNKNIGLIKYREKLYSFADTQAAIEFCRNPSYYIEKVVEFSRSNSSYIQLLHLYKFFPSVEILEKSKSFTKQRLLGQLPVVSEVSCQVDTHIVDQHIDRRYKWNEWDFRRDALMYVNLKSKTTKSMQTNLSHYRRDSETQYNQPKEQAVQTRKSSYTFVPRNARFLKGLRHSGEPIPRGIYESNKERRYHFESIDLTIDQDGSPVPYKVEKKDVGV